MSLQLTIPLLEDLRQRVNIAIMRTFTMIRKAIFLNKDLQLEIESIKRIVTSQDEQIAVIFEYIRQLEKSKQADQDQANRKRVGFRWPKYKNT